MWVTKIVTYKNKKTIDDITLATQSKNFDIIIGGHSHTFMPAPQIVLNQQQQEVVINHAGYGGIVLLFWLAVAVRFSRMQ